MTQKMVEVDDQKWRQFRLLCLKNNTTIKKELDRFLNKKLKGEKK